MTYGIAGTFNTLVTLDAAIDNPTFITQLGRLTDGLQVSYQGLTVVNAGSIAGYSCIKFLTAGSLTNQSGGAISGRSGGIYGEGGAVTVVNAGSITVSSGNGVILVAGSVTNQSGGAIRGLNAIFGDGAVTVVNAGSITGSNGGIFFNAGGSSPTKAAA